MTLFRMILKLMGWTIEGADNLSTKAVVTVAPHTSYYDGFIGYIAMMALGLNFRVIGAKHLFSSPLKYVMKFIMHGMPCGKGQKNSILSSLRYLSENGDGKIVICPEGTIAKRYIWHNGFYVMAKRAGVPIDTVVLNYDTKTIHIMPEISSDTEYNDVLSTMISYYNEYACGKKHYNFALPTIDTTKLT